MYWVGILSNISLLVADIQAEYYVNHCVNLYRRNLERADSTYCVVGMNFNKHPLSAYRGTGEKVSPARVKCH